MKRFNPLVERVAVSVLLASSSAACLFAARFGSAGLPALDKQKAAGFQAMFWFVGVLLSSGAVGVLWSLVVLVRDVKSDNLK